MELWIPITIAAAFFQNLRSALQKHLKTKLSTGGASYARFFYAWPFAVIYCWALAEFWSIPYPAINLPFITYCVMGGMAQIVFTFLLLHLFSFRNFAVGTTYSKTEVVQVAIFGFVLLGDKVSLGAALAIVLSLGGVVALSVAHGAVTFRNLIASLTEKTTLIGLTCGAFLGLSVVFFRAAALSLAEGNFTMRAAFTLAVSVVIQTTIMGVYLRIREPGQITAVIRNWPPALAVGLAGVLASICWFTAFTIQNAAYVRALGQIELVFTFIASVVFFRERSNRMEIGGILLIVVAILILLRAG